MAITIFNGPDTGAPQPTYTLATFVAQTPIVVINGVAAGTGGAAVPTTGQIWPRGSHA